MPFDGVVTKAVTEELHEQLVEGRITKIHQPTDTELVLTVRNNRKNHALLFSIHPTYARFHITSDVFQNPAEPPMFCMHMRKYIQGGFIEDIQQDALERVITFHIQSRNDFGDRTTLYLVMELMGRHSNVLLLNDSKDMIMDAMKHIPRFQNRHRTILPGQPYIKPPEQNKLHPLEIDEEVFIKTIDFNAGKINRQIVQSLQGFSPVLATELTSRAHLGNMDAYKQAFKDIQTEIRSQAYVPAIYENNREDFHVIPLHHLQGETKEYASSNALIDSFYTGKAERDRVKQRAHDIERLIRNELKKNKRKQAIHEQTLKKAKKAATYQKQGELLTAHLHLVNMGDESVVVTDYYDPDQGTMTIPLETDKTPSENAQAYFKTYRKLERAQSKAELERKKTKAEIIYLEDLLHTVSVAREEDIEEIREELREGGYIRKQPARKRKKKQKPRPQQFLSSDGTMIYVGKNNKQNDYVTHTLAQRNDIWLHTKDIPGSHVIIRKMDPSEKTIEEAAILAAYFSKAQQSDSVPVDFTKVRHVRKPNGAKPGFVIYEQEQTLFVTPDQKRVDELAIKHKQ
ncbi:MAG TPA: NFACT RNA binding domain-containing protein [Bacillota bacterium]|nr:NFACT RNA binding domain-containing protein [Bacillota bacterium]